MFDLTTWGPLLHLALGVAISIFVSLFLGAIFSLTMRILGRHRTWPARLAPRVRNPLRVLLAIVGIWASVAIVYRHSDWLPSVHQPFQIAMIAALVWLLVGLVYFLGASIIESQADGVDSESRRIRTQAVVLRRLLIVAIVVVGVGSALMTFPGVQAVGASLLASAGIVSIVAGFAAQSVLGNLVAGIQLAFTDQMRVGDIVVVEGEWGHIGELTLSYVVVYIWDERRLVLPCTYFTTQPFEVWTRRSDEVLGTVYMDLDWRVPVEPLRAEFQRIVEGSPAWDHRKASVLVTGSQGGYLTVRFLISAADSDDQWDLRCLVREKIVDWLQREHPDALPVTRVRVEPDVATA